MQSPSKNHQSGVNEAFNKRRAAVLAFCLYVHVFLVSRFNNLHRGAGEGL